MKNAFCSLLDAFLKLHIPPLLVLGGPTTQDGYEAPLRAKIVAASFTQIEVFD